MTAHTARCPYCQKLNHDLDRGANTCLRCGKGFVVTAATYDPWAACRVPEDITLAARKVERWMAQNNCTSLAGLSRVSK